MRYYKVDQNTVDDVEFESQHSTAFDLKAHINSEKHIEAYNPHQKKVGVPVRNKNDGKGFFITIQPQFRVKVPLGVRFSIPVKYQLRITSNQDLSYEYGITLLNGTEIYEADKTDEISVVLYNNSDTPVYIYDKDVVARATLNKVLEYTLEETNRKIAPKPLKGISVDQEESVELETGETEDQTDNE